MDAPATPVSNPPLHAPVEGSAVPAQATSSEEEVQIHNNNMNEGDGAAEGGLPMSGGTATAEGEEDNGDDEVYVPPPTLADRSFALLANAQRSDVFLPLLRSNDKSLRELSLKNTCVTKPTLDMIGDALRGNKTLNLLDLSDNDLADEDLEYFINVCLKANLGLMRLNLSGNGRLTTLTLDRLLDVIKDSNDSLTVIDSKGTQISDAVAKSFTEMAALNRFPAHFKQQVFRAMRNDPDLFKIQLIYDKSDPKVLNEIGIATLARALTHIVVETPEEAERHRRPQQVLCGNEELDGTATPSAVAAGDDIMTPTRAQRAAAGGEDEVLATVTLRNSTGGIPIAQLERISNENGSVMVRPASPQVKRELIQSQPQGNNTVRTLRLDDRCCRGERCVEALLPAIATNPHLAVIGLSANYLGDESVRMLCGAIKRIGDRCGLEELDLSYNEITDAGVKMLIDCVAANTSLKSIILTGNKTLLDPQLLQLLQQGTALNCEPSSMKVAVEKIKRGYPKNMTREEEREAYIRQNSGEFTDERGILRLEGTDNDVEKGPSKGYFTSLGCSTIAAALPTNITIHTIHFKNNHIGPEGAKALAEVLEYNPTLVRIDLRHNPITDEGARKLLTALKINDTIVSLDMTEGCQVSKRLLDEVAAVTHLNRQPVPIKEHLKYPFNQAPSETLDLRRRNMQVRGKWKSLFPESMPYVLSILAAQPKTRILDLSDNDTLGDEGVLMLLDWIRDPRCNLKRLDISNTAITSATVDAITNALRSNYSLTSVVVAGNRDVNTRPRQAMEEALGLNVFPPAVKDIVPLLSANIDGIDTVSFIRHPDDYYKKEAKIAVPPPLGDDAAKILFSTLMQNTHVAAVTLRNQQISNRGLHYASECLSVNPIITSLDLSDNMIGPDGIMDFAAMLERNTTLTRIDLSGNPLGIDGGNRLLLAMQTSNRSVRYINLQNCRIRDDTRRQIEALAAFNTQSASFRHLVLDRIVTTKTVYYRGGVDNSEQSAKKNAKNAASAAALLGGYASASAAPTSSGGGGVGVIGGRAASMVGGSSSTNSGGGGGGGGTMSDAILALLNDDGKGGAGISGAGAGGGVFNNNNLTPDFLGDDAIDTLIMALDSYSKHHVRSIQLPNNHITDAGVRRLLYLLHKNPSITDVDLINNPLTDGVVREVTAFLSTHTHIKRFVVGNEDRPDDVSKALLFGQQGKKEKEAEKSKGGARDDASQRKEDGDAAAAAEEDGGAPAAVANDPTLANSQNVAALSAASRIAANVVGGVADTSTADGFRLLGGPIAVNGAAAAVAEGVTTASTLAAAAASAAAMTASSADDCGGADLPDLTNVSAISAGMGNTSAAPAAVSSRLTTLEKGGSVAAAKGFTASVEKPPPPSAPSTGASSGESPTDQTTATAAAAGHTRKYAGGAKRADATAADLIPHCTMSALGIRHIRIAVALNNASPVFRHKYNVLSQQMLKWCELTAHSQRILKSRIGNREARDALKQVVGGGSSVAFEGNSGIGGGEAQHDPIAAAIMRECNDEFLISDSAAVGVPSALKKQPAHAANTTASGNNNRYSTGTSANNKNIAFYNYGNNTVAGSGTGGGASGAVAAVAASRSAAMMSSAAGIGAQQITSKKELAQLVASAAPEVVQFNQCDMSLLELRLLLNLLVRPVEGIIINQQQMLLYGMALVPPPTLVTPPPAASSSINTAAANGSGAVSSANASVVSAATAGPFVSLPPSPGGPITPSVATIPDGEVLRNHVRGISLAGNYGIDDECVEVLVREYLMPVMAMDLNANAASPLINNGSNLNLSTSSAAAAAAADGNPTATTAATFVPLFLQALILDGCSINGHCLRTLYDLCKRSNHMVVVGLEGTILSSAIVKQTLADEHAAEVAEARRLELEERQRNGSGAMSSDEYKQLVLQQEQRAAQKAASASASAAAAAVVVDDTSNAVPPLPSSSSPFTSEEDLIANLNKPLRYVEDPEELRSILEVYARGRDRIVALLAANRNRMVGLASDELFAAHAAGGGAAAVGMGSGSPSSSSPSAVAGGARNGGGASSASASAAAVASLGAHSAILMRSGGVANPYANNTSVTLGGDLVRGPTAASLGVGALGAVGGPAGLAGIGGGDGYHTDNAAVVFMAGGGDHAPPPTIDRSTVGTANSSNNPKALLSNNSAFTSTLNHHTSATYDAPHSYTTNNYSTANTSAALNATSASVGGSRSRLESSLQYGRSLKEAIPTTYDDHKATEDSIFNDAIAAAPRRRLDHGEHIRSLYGGGGTTTEGGGLGGRRSSANGGSGVVLPKGYASGYGSAAERSSPNPNPSSSVVGAAGTPTMLNSKNSSLNGSTTMGGGTQLGVGGKLTTSRR